MKNSRFIYKLDENGKMQKYIVVKCKYGEYLRPYNPPLVRSEGQINQQNIYKYLSEQWDTLTKEEINIWLIRSKEPGNVRKCTDSGYIEARAMFFHLNSNLIEAGLPIIKTVEILELPQAFTKIDSKIIEEDGRTEITLSFDKAINEQTRVIVKATPPKKETVNYVNPDQYKQIAILDSTFVNGGYITKDYFNYFKQLPELGEKIKIKLRVIDARFGTMYDYYGFFSCFET